MNLLVKENLQNCLKLANNTSVFKKGAHTSKNNSRPVCILLVFSKIFRKVLQKQLLVFFDIFYQRFSAVFENNMKRKAAY